MARPKNPLADTWPLLLIGTGFSAIALAALIIAALHLINHLRAQTWVEHPAVLESIGESHSPAAGQRLNSERTTRLEGRYHYQWQGREITGERLSFSTIHAYNLDGDLMQYEAEGDLLAVCLQHEIDHLDGILFIDHLGRLRRELIRKKLKKQARQHAPSNKKQVAM